MSNIEDGARKRFVRKYNQIKELIIEGKVVEAKEELTKLKEKGSWNLYEDAFYWYLSSLYFRVTEDFDKEYRDILKLVDLGEEKLPKDSYVGLMHRGFQLALHQNQFSTAEYFSRRIKRNDEVLFENISPTLDKIRDVKDGNQDIIVAASIDERKNWFHYLYRNNFTIAEVNGNIDAIEVRCNNTRHSFAFAENQTWNIPESWQGCRLMVTGEENSQFKLVELANKA